MTGGNMIRTATRSDINAIAELLEEFLVESAYAQHCNEINRLWLKKIIYTALQQGYIWLLIHDELVNGCLIAIKEQNIWIPEKVTLREMVWYVRDQYRRSPGAGRLFLAFCDKGEELMENKEIDGYFTTRMATTDNYDLTKRGFREVERLFFRD